MSTQFTGMIVHAAVGGTEEHSSGPRSADFLRRLFRYLDESGTRYCVLHSWRNLPDELASDLDIAVHPEDRVRLGGTFRRLSQDGFPPIQLINHNVNGYYFVFCWHSGRALRTAAVDVIFEHRRRGLISAGVRKLRPPANDTENFGSPLLPRSFPTCCRRKLRKEK